jgi:lysine decarboxylase
MTAPDPLGSAAADPLGLAADAPLLAAGDVPLAGGVDTVKFAHGRLAEAERRAAELFRADVCRFSVGGSTHCNQALARTVGVPGLGALEGPGVDPAKLTVTLAGAGAQGVDVEADLIAAGLPVEMADRDTIVAIVTVADEPAAVRRLTAALIAPYPPGVPVLAPGELVTAEALAALRQARDDGVRIAYARDPALETIEVLVASE